MSMRAQTAVVSFSMLLTACGSDDLEFLSDVREKILVDGRALRLEAELTRSFLPPESEEGSPLTAAIAVVTVDLDPFPDFLRLDGLWVIYDGTIWFRALTHSQQCVGCPHAYALTAAAYDGPLWGPDVYADTVVRLTKASESYYLGAAQQLIRRAE